MCDRWSDVRSGSGHPGSRTPSGRATRAGVAGMTRVTDIYGPGHNQADYLRPLAAACKTGWWDHHGVPAPWPDNYDDNDTAVRTDEPGQTETNLPSERETEGSTRTPPGGT